MVRSYADNAKVSFFEQRLLIIVPILPVDAGEALQDEHCRKLLTST
jgi:hypothetical protein